MPLRFGTLRPWLAAGCLSVLAISAPGAAQRDSEPTSRANVPLKVDPAWKQIKTGDITVASDGSLAVMRSALAELEGLKQAFQMLSPRWQTRSPVPTVLVLFKDEASFDVFRPRDAAGRKRASVVGYFTERPHVNYMVTFVQSGGRLNLSTILHEYTHFVASRNLRILPAWMNEGLAEFYSTFESNSDNGQLLIGRPPAGRVQTLRRGGAIRLEQMLRPESASRLVRDERTAPMFYAQSWALVHYLMMGHEGRREGQLNTYLTGLAEGRSLEQAFTAAFHSTYDELQLELSLYTLRWQYPAVVFTKPEPGPESNAPAAPLLERDALQLQGDILVSIGAWRDAEEALVKARTLDAAFGPTEMSFGLLQVGRARPAAAREVFGQAARAAPETFGPQYYLGSVLLDAGDYAGAARALAEATELVRDSSPTWFRLSVARLGLGDRSGADQALQRAIESDSRQVWAYNRARLAWRMQLDTVIIDDVTSAIRQRVMDPVTTAYAALLAAAAAWRLQQPELATHLLTDARANTDEAAWTTKVLDFALGHINATTLLGAARTNAHSTEARAYVGLRWLFEGRRAAAMPHLVWVRDRGDKNYVEYQMVAEVLKRLGQS